MMQISSDKFAWLVMEKSDETDPEKLLEIYRSAIILAKNFNKPSQDANAKNLRQ